MMEVLKNGAKVKINNSPAEWEQHEKPYYAESEPIINNRVVQAYMNRELLTVVNVRTDKSGTFVCDLLTSEKKILSGFYAWELV